MSVHYTDDHLTIHAGDVREVLPTLPAESVHCVVTSPPYWGLRDYGTATWEGGDEACAHKRKPGGTGGDPKYGPNKGQAGGAPTPMGQTCIYCGAHRIDSQLGLEPTPEEYVADLVAIFREVRRVLRADGTVWLNLGDSYNNRNATRRSSHQGGLGFESADLSKSWVELKAEGRTRMAIEDGDLKEKDLVGIPWMVAFALRADGWYLRSDIIWSKPNPMPESVTDRPTKAHEYLFLLTKSARYYFDGESVRLPVSPFNTGIVSVAPHGAHVAEQGHRKQERRQYDEIKGANIRTVWTIATQPYPGAHFATFPERLVEPCVKAGTSERGVCPECGAPWERVVERTTGHDWNAHKRGNDRLVYGNGTGATQDRNRIENPPRTIGWRPGCAHDAEPVPATVLDPFAGSGTTARVANRLGRRAVLVELNPDYIDQALTRNAQAPLGLGA